MVQPLARRRGGSYLAFTPVRFIYLISRRLVCLLHEIIKPPARHVYSLQHRKDYGATLQLAGIACFRVCLEVQKLIFNEGSSVGMCSVRGADAQQGTWRGPCVIRAMTY